MINKLIDLLFKKVFYLKLKQQKRGKYMFTIEDEMVKNAVFMIISGLWTMDDIIDFDNFKEMVIARLTFKKEEAKKEAEELNKIDEVAEEPIKQTKPAEHPVGYEPEEDKKG